VTVHSGENEDLVTEFYVDWQLTSSFSHTFNAYCEWMWIWRIISATLYYSSDSNLLLCISEFEKIETEKKNTRHSTTLQLKCAFWTYLRCTFSIVCIMWTRQESYNVGSTYVCTIQYIFLLLLFLRSSWRMQIIIIL